ncbi:hypothetical protein VL04_04075 [Chromobacterium violaceum]|nr:hypothetical protein VK93_16280 [Chromobacterium violaceum]KMN85601.1 hypothetical protein VL02_13345 [Chromobacterium violaceum]KMN91506.1 hypothetical protein VL04_04075 [Chromobacterium violaceum]KMO05690.1 hypothetical protein VL16_00790 [Chromobacterium violaceum]
MVKIMNGKDSFSPEAPTILRCLIFKIVNYISVDSLIGVCVFAFKAPRIGSSFQPVKDYKHTVSVFARTQVFKFLKGQTSICSICIK